MKIDKSSFAVPSAHDVVAFWADAGPAQWFAKNPDFDRRFRERFLDMHLAVARPELDDWLSTPLGTLALLLLTDQFPRTAFRGTAHMYATDTLARHFAKHAHVRRQMEQVERPLRLFFCLPFAHSENPADQKISVELNGGLGQPWLVHALGHRATILRFGRFPHRNPLLRRETTEEESRFLAEGGFAG
ncbi:MULTISPECIES: DUF924 family protein [Ralstonia]|jgi:uncharacterized protein (DUF924 family)|uniref:DUF924 domain-containing protein n=2 Tax=Ralstonia pickettii TaxID=329 RepID=A0ABM9IL27_RALPI|nr:MULTISPECIES: DUF924 family protein [Ralstonia]MBA4200549.1 DUF924 domain-containing protein [Ralstonia sp.]MBA4230399.1 DUF924 domain-containing protein [Ralstonia sp.]MBA4236991.1 DUF924 domain-containing protein [Ralstonia sp.]MBA4279486.1 DUF924 domain-containing protein [Ralstonia sp.]MBA4402269.1 DUF924 domain-containing protein [Ralstonia sp.]